MVRIDRTLLNWRDEMISSSVLLELCSFLPYHTILAPDGYHLWPEVFPSAHPIRYLSTDTPLTVQKKKSSTLCNGSGRLQKAAAYCRKHGSRYTGSQAKYQTNHSKINKLS